MSTRSPERRAAAAASGRRSRLRYPERQLARNAVYRAIKSGRLIRATHCERCGTECRTEGSHGDYSKRLEVEWLCRPCHALKDQRELCINGHRFSETGYYQLASGARSCAECKRQKSAAYKAKKRAEHA